MGESYAERLAGMARSELETAQASIPIEETRDDLKGGIRFIRGVLIAALLSLSIWGLVLWILL